MSAGCTTNYDTETLYTERDLARITKRSIASLRRDRLSQTGCPYVKWGKLVRYDPRDVRKYLESLKRRTLGRGHQ